jgi:hypothetical protein
LTNLTDDDGKGRADKPLFEFPLQRKAVCNKGTGEFKPKAWFVLHYSENANLLKNDHFKAAGET